MNEKEFKQFMLDFQRGQNDRDQQIFKRISELESRMSGSENHIMEQEKKLKTININQRQCFEKRGQFTKEIAELREWTNKNVEGLDTKFTDIYNDLKEQLNELKNSKPPEPIGKKGKRVWIGEVPLIHANQDKDDLKKPRENIDTSLWSNLISLKEHDKEFISKFVKPIRKLIDDTSYSCSYTDKFSDFLRDLEEEIEKWEDKLK